ncbi:MAG TPA: fluoride efflux transporter CrcB [Actinoplanes sp.]|nr:fluoride efflux transporter CrcB [Actinoplanes sp.]
MTALLVMLGAALGAPLRYLADRAVQQRHDSAFPWGTFTVNVVGSFIVGLLIRGTALHEVPGGLGALLGTGLCGALTTYSTFGYETVRLLTDRARAFAVLNVAASIGAGLGAAYCGLAVADALWA